MRELRGDASLAEFDLASGAVSVALASQTDHKEHIADFNDNVQPTVRVGLETRWLIFWFSLPKHLISNFIGLGCILRKLIKFSFEGFIGMRFFVLFK